jgi:hypothetical protein
LKAKNAFYLKSSYAMPKAEQGACAFFLIATR